MAKPTVLLYNFTDQKRKNKIRAFCVMNGIRIRTVAKEDYGKPLYQLLEKETGGLPEVPLPATEQAASETEETVDFSEELLVMCHVGSGMNAFLAHLRKEQVIVPLKAILTPTNQFWSSFALYQEIRKEHEAMSRQP